MTISLLCIGHMKDRSLQALSQEYCKRLQAFCHAEIIEVKDEAGTHDSREGEVRRIKEIEAARAMEKIRPDDFCILLDLHGEAMDSVQFAEKLAGWQTKSSRLIFVIAGSLGPGTALLNRANFRWKLSDLTFTHLMTRVLVLEQIYRGFMINSGRTYHK